MQTAYYSIILRTEDQDCFAAVTKFPTRKKRRCIILCSCKLQI